jgi:hypothetical protein
MRYMYLIKCFNFCFTHFLITRKKVYIQRSVYSIPPPRFATALVVVM